VKNNKYDLIFLDPPFAEDQYQEDLQLIKKFGIYPNNHLVIIHRENNKTKEFNKDLNILEIKIYGRSKIIFGSFN
jgi:16S rRNA G966 N2-methylase RsmD